jgi:hypothetical protein
MGTELDTLVDDTIAFVNRMAKTRRHEPLLSMPTNGSHDTVDREVQVLKKAAAKSKKSGKPVAIVSYDEKPGIQASHNGGRRSCLDYASLWLSYCPRRYRILAGMGSREVKLGT